MIPGDPLHVLDKLHGQGAYVAFARTAHTKSGKPCVVVRHLGRKHVLVLVELDGLPPFYKGVRFNYVLTPDEAKFFVKK